jgi:hypothetical protein
VIVETFFKIGSKIFREIFGNFESDVGIMQIEGRGGPKICRAENESEV